MPRIASTKIQGGQKPAIPQPTTRFRRKFRSATEEARRESPFHKRVREMFSQVAASHPSTNNSQHKMLIALERCSDDASRLISRMLLAQKYFCCSAQGASCNSIHFSAPKSGRCEPSCMRRGCSVNAVATEAGLPARPVERYTFGLPYLTFR
jgi:hypothetical protein